MQSIFRNVFAVVIFTVVFGVATSFAQDPGKIRELYRRMGENQKTLRSLNSRVRMESYNSQIKETETKDGTVKYLPAGTKNANIRIDWTAPQQEILSVVDGNYKLYRPRLETVYVGKTKEVQKQNQGIGNSLAFMNMTSAQLKQNFDAKWLSDGELIANGSVSAYRVKLTPKTAANYSFAEVWVTEEGMPVQVKVHEKNNDTTTVLLYDVQKNARVNKNDLKLEIPKGTKEIKG